MVAAETLAVREEQALAVAENTYPYEEAEELEPRRTVVTSQDLWSVDGNFMGLLANVAVAASRDYTRPVLCGVYLEPQEDGTLRLAATDTYRLMLHDTQADVAAGASALIVPLDFIRKEWPAAVKANGGKRSSPSHAKQSWSAVTTTEYKVCHRRIIHRIGERWSSVTRTEITEEPILVKCQSSTVVSITVQAREPITVTFTSLDGQFVNYRRVMPQGDGEGRLTVSADHLNRCLKVVLPVALEDANRVVFSLTDQGAVKVTARYEESLCGGVGQAVAIVGGDRTGIEPNFAANGEYIRDFLALCRGAVKLDYWGPLNSMVWRSAEYEYVLMPMQII